MLLLIKIPVLSEAFFLFIFHSSKNGAVHNTKQEQRNKEWDTPRENTRIYPVPYSNHGGEQHRALKKAYQEVSHAPPNPYFAQRF